MLKRGSQHEKGQSLVEFALALPILILILSGLIDLGRAYFAYIFLEEATAEAALFLSINANCENDSLPQCADPNNALWRAQNSGSRQGIVNKTAIDIAVRPFTTGVGNTVIVDGEYPFRFITPGFVALGQITLKVTASHVIITE